MTGINPSTDTLRAKKSRWFYENMESSVAIFLTCVCVYIYIIIFLSAIRRLSIIPQNIRFSWRKRYGSIFILSSIDLSLDGIFFFIASVNLCFLFLLFFFLFSFRHFREDTHGESWFLGHPQKWRITVNVNFWGAERVKRCVYRRSSRGIYFACCWRGKYFSRCSMALEPNFSWKRVLFVNRYRVIRLIDTFRSRIRLLKMLI